MRSGGAAQGYTLVELVVSMMIFGIVMTLISVSFGNIVRNAGQLGKRTETDIGGLIGLEVMRIDLGLAGFGLPWSGTKELNYIEAPEDMQLVTSCPDGCPDAKASRYNDKPFLDEPPAFRVGNNVGFNGSDYLVLKGSALGVSSVCRQWGYLNYSAVIRPSRVEPELKKGGKDRAVVVKSGTNASGNPTRELVTRGSDFTLVLEDKIPDAFAPKEKGESYLVYGVAPEDEEGAGLNFPFNRSDYYIDRKSDISPLCNKQTGTLYKTTINHQGGYTRYPILDCAADMQVIYYIDTNSDNEVDYRLNPGDATLKSEDLRKQLKEIRVYILAQQGKKDPSYAYPVRETSRAIIVGDPELPPDLGRVWSESELRASFGADWRNYRWKVYTIVVQPKNL